MSWLLIAVLAYFLLALVNLADKFLLEKFLPNSKAYTFLVSVLGTAVWILAPWFLVWSGWGLFWGNLLVGALFPIALLLLYRALKLGEASRIIPMIGGTIPVFILILSLIFLGETFTSYQWIAIGLLLVGTVVISIVPDSHDLWDKIKIWFDLGEENRINSIISALGAAAFFAVFFVGTKYLYSQQPFFSSFIWMRIGSLLAALILLIPSNIRRQIFHSLTSLKKRGRTIFIGNQILAAIGFVLQNYAIALTSVVLVSMLQGIQYAFLLIMGALVSIFYPQAIKENISRKIVIQKIIAIILVGAGLYFITI